MGEIPRNISPEQYQSSETKPIVAREISSPREAAMLLQGFVNADIARRHGELLGKFYEKPGLALRPEQVRITTADPQLTRLNRLRSAEPTDPDFKQYAQEKLTVAIRNLAARVSELANKTRNPQEEQNFQMARARLKEFNEAARRLGIEPPLKSEKRIVRPKQKEEPPNNIEPKEIATLIANGLKERKNRPGIWADIIKEVGLFERGANNLAEAQAIYLTKLPFLIDRDRTLIWPTKDQSARFRFVIDTIGPDVNEAAENIADYLNRALEKIKR